MKKKIYDRQHDVEITDVESRLNRGTEVEFAVTLFPIVTSFIFCVRLRSQIKRIPDHNLFDHLQIHREPYYREFKMSNADFNLPAICSLVNGSACIEKSQQKRLWFEEIVERLTLRQSALRDRYTVCTLSVHS